jgi:CHAT domain-containing protein
LEKNNEEDSPKGISIIGNPEIKFPEMLAGFQGHVKSDFLESEISDVAILLGMIPNVGASATKEHFISEFNSSSLMHLSTYGSHEKGTIILAPVADINPRVVARDSWEITLEDVVVLRNAPDVVVLTFGYGCRNRFKELATFNAYLPLAFMLAGVKTVVMATWSTPHDALLASLRKFYKNISDVSARNRFPTH